MGINKSEKTLIYVRVECLIQHWHPVRAIHEHEDCYRIIDTNPDPEHFYLRFSFGDIVQCKENEFAENEFGLIAVEKCNHGIEI